MPQPDLVIFDCDGVLVDSEIIAARVDAGLLSAAGYPIDADDYAERFAGLTFRDILLRVEAESQIPFQARLIDESERLLDERLRAEVRAIEGAHEAVASVQTKRCICSNSKLHRLQFMLEKVRLLPFFGEHIYSARDNPGIRHKPAPDIFLQAAKKEGARPEATFVVEHSVHGVTGAVAAGMRVIGFTGASHTYPGHADQLTDAGAETVIRRWADFAGSLAALSEWSEA
ncbi:MAG TPA: HAD-IA family hydrolase [Tianweitania sediminis]|nr:HAD-IA family hydrolase [Tianweitania sediminis]